MSRLAAAFRKASAGGQAGSASRQPPSMWDVVPGLSGGVQVPWDLKASIERVPRPPFAPAARSAEIAAPATPLPSTPRDHASEEVIALIRRVYEPGHAANRRRAILFTAVGVESVSARVSATVAGALAAQTSASVCLVEANLRSPTLADSGGAGVGGGLADMLLGSGTLPSLLIPLASNLSLLPAGTRTAEAVQRLTPEQLGTCVTELRATFDYLVVNAAAATVHRDATILAPLLDGVVLVVAASGTRREAFRRTVELLQQAGANILGAVMVDRTFPIPEALYRRI